MARQMRPKTPHKRPAKMMMSDAEMKRRMKSHPASGAMMSFQKKLRLQRATHARPKMRGK